MPKSKKSAKQTKKTANTGIKKTLSNRWLTLVIVGAVVLVGAVVVSRSFASGGSFMYSVSSCQITQYTPWGGSTKPKFVLSQGSTGSCVKMLQNGLIKMNFMNKSAGADGIYGTKTAGGVLLSETFYHLKNPDRTATYCTVDALAKAEYVGRDNVNGVIKYMFNSPVDRLCL